MNKNSILKVRSLGLAVAAVLATGSFSATSYATSTVTAALAVSATVVSACSLSTTPVSLGSVDQLNTQTLNGTGGLVVQCTNGAAASITLDQGTHATGASSDAAPLRKMVNSTNTGDGLAYVITQDGSSTIWGNTAATGLGYTGTGATETKSVYISIPQGQNAPVGTYSDTVTATITF